MKIIKPTTRQKFSAVLPLIENAGIKAALAWEKFQRKDSILKSKREIVTKTDKATEAYLIKEISNLFPDHAFLGEESGASTKKSDYIWIIDPIDGTTNFSIHHPLWSISVGLAYKGEIIFGAIYAPMLKEMFYAERGKGAYLNKRRIKLAKSLTGGKLVHAFCHGGGLDNIKLSIEYYRVQKLGALDCRQLGSAAVELAFVASGRIDSLVIPGARSWDVAAGSLIAKEAGAEVCDFFGKDWNLKSPDIAVFHQSLKKEILAAVKKAKKLYVKN